jgi:hypothetical protein
MLIIRDAVAIPAQEHRQVVVDICLGKFVRKLLEIQHSLSIALSKYVLGMVYYGVGD